MHVSPAYAVAVTQCEREMMMALCDVRVEGGEGGWEVGSGKCVCVCVLPLRKEIDVDVCFVVGQRLVVHSVCDANCMPH